MQYMLLVYLDENALSEAERNACYDESVQLTQDLHATGHFVAASITGECKPRARFTNLVDSDLLLVLLGRDGQ